MLYTDQLNRKIELSSAPKRIISLVPSQTELLYDLGLRDEVVGITKFCIHPEEWFHTKTRVGGTKKINFDVIEQLQPDLIIGNKEENEKEQIEQLMKRPLSKGGKVKSPLCKGGKGDYTPVWMSDIYSLKDALDMITHIGALVNKQQEALLLKLQIEAAFKQLEITLLSRSHSYLQTTNYQPLPAAYFIWKDPLMVAGNNTFINDMLKRCGLNNVFADTTERYPEVGPEQIAAASPKLILLSSEPYPFKEKHLIEFQAICPNAKIMIVDGELFSWYGSRLLQAPSYYEKLFTNEMDYILT